MKRFFALGLALALALGLPVIAAADEPLSMLPAVNDYANANYADVSADSWYAQAAQVCYETGLMTGTQNGFEAELTLTGGQLAAIAARLREAIVGDSIVRGTALPGQTLPWYYWEVQYLQKAGIQVPEPEAPATRLEFARLLCAVAPASYTPAINAITALPDSGDAEVLRLYNAGILTGSDAYGTFNPSGTLRRHECAAMVARVVRPDLRQRFTLQPAGAQTTAPSAPLTYEEELMQTEALRINGGVVPFSVFLQTLNELIFEIDFGMAAQGGQRLDWDAKYSGVDDLETYFVDLAIREATQEYVLAYQSVALGCEVDDLPQALTPDPGAALGNVYRAKHILVQDEATAVTLLTKIMNAGTLEYFDLLLAQYGTDPGMDSNPNGYLFTDGDMVSEFENAVKALDIGSCSSAPVRSSFGWHIILRLDPKGYPDWEKSVQSMMYEKYLDSWMNSVSVTPNSVELGKLDVRGRYQQYLEGLGF